MSSTSRRLQRPPLLGPAPTFTRTAGGSDSGSNSYGPQSFTIANAGDTAVFMASGFFDSTGIGTISIDGGGALNPAVSIASGASGGTAQNWSAIWLVTGLSAASHTLTWTGAALSVKTVGTLSGNATTTVSFTNSSTSGGATISAGPHTLTKNSLLLVACGVRSNSAGNPTSADAGSTNIDLNSGTPGPAINWRETLATGAKTVTANIQAGLAQSLAAIAVGN